jgi:hypothetical protein
MAYSFTTGGSSSITATELVAGIFDQIESKFYDKKYPDILWRTILPPESIKTDINPGAISYLYRSRDISGMGQFVRGNPNNIPRVGQSVGQVSVPILDAAVGATLTDADARRYQFGMQSSLATDFGEIMKKAADYHVERTFFFGNAAANFASFLDYSTVPKITPVTAWTGADPTVWIDGINSGITTVWTNSKTVHMPDTVLLPPAKFAMLTAPAVIGQGVAGLATSALAYLKSNNIYTQMTGKELTVLPLRYLTGAGAAAADRAVFMEMNPDNFVMPFPLAYQLAQPVPIPLGVELFAEYIFGSFNVRYPYAMAYMDGI